MSSLCGSTICGKRSVRIATIAAVSSTDSVVWVMKASSCRRSSAGSARASASVSISVTAPAGNCPMVPTTSGWPAWPMSTISRPRAEMDLRLAMHLGDQRAGGVEMEEIARACAASGTALATPWAEKITGWSVSGISSSSSTNTAPFAFRLVDHIAVVDDLVAHIDRRPELLQRQFDDLDRPVDAGAEAARRAKQDIERRLGHRRGSSHGTGDIRESPGRFRQEVGSAPNQCGSVVAADDCGQDCSTKHRSGDFLFLGRAEDQLARLRPPSSAGRRGSPGTNSQPRS